MASIPARQPSQRRQSRPDEARRSTSQPAHSPVRARSEDSQTIFVNTPEHDEEPQEEQTQSNRPPLPQDDPSIKKCWICFADSTEDTPETSPWRDPCPCALQAHEECLLDWIADTEAPKNPRNREGITAPKITCPQCKSEIKLSRPRDYLVDIYRSVERLNGKFVAPGSLFVLSSMLYNFSMAHGMHSIYAIFGADDGERLLRPLLHNATRAPVEAYAGRGASEQLLKVMMDHVYHWRLYFGLPLITPILVLSRTSLADGILPVLPIVFFASQAHSPDEALDFAQWPPSASFAFAVLPYVRSLYNLYYKKVWAEREKRWLKEIQPRATQAQTDANGNPVDNANGNQQNQNGDENVFEVRIDGGIWNDWEDEEQVEQAIDANNNMAEAVQAPQEEDAAAPGPVVQDNRPEPGGGANERPMLERMMDERGQQQQQQQQNQQNQQNPQNGQNAQGAQERRLSFSPTTIAETVLGALVFPTLAGLTGEALKLVLPRSWTDSPECFNKALGGRHVKAGGFFQHKWARSLIGGCLLVVCKDALTLYVRWKMAQMHRGRAVVNFDRKRDGSRGAAS